MNLKIIDKDFSICKLDTLNLEDLSGMYFLSCTNDEISLLIESSNVPKSAEKIDEGWRAFRVDGQLEFSQIGIIAAISAILAEKSISIFVTSTYDTDYVLTRAKHFDSAVKALKDAGYTFLS